MSTKEPVINLPCLYVNYLNIAWASNTTLTVSVGACRDDSNTFDMSITAPITINGAVNGVNGLDASSLAASTWYAVYVIGSSTNSKPISCLISTSTTVPTMPAGYDVKRRIGWALTDGSTHFLKAVQIGSGSVKKYYWDAQPVALNGGTQGSWTTISLKVGVPPVDNIEVMLEAAITPTAAGNYLEFRPSASSSNYVTTVSGVVAAVAQSLVVSVVASLDTGEAKIGYQVVTGTASASVISFSDQL
jgi:hypothetical protein